LITAKCGQQPENLKIVIKKDSIPPVGNMVYKETGGIKVLQTHRAEIPGMNYAEGFCVNNALVTDRPGDGDVIIPVHISILDIT
jgi:hypothetical protein